MDGQVLVTLPAEVLQRAELWARRAGRPPGPPHRLGVAACDAAFTVRREVVFEMGVGVGPQHLYGVGAARRWIGWLLR